MCVWGGGGGTVVVSLNYKITVLGKVARELVTSMTDMLVGIPWPRIQ